MGHSISGVGVLDKAIVILGACVDGASLAELRADLVHHPVERDICQTIVGITAADLRMRAGKPHLL